MYGENNEQKKISLAAFNISEFPVTNRQFQAFVDAGGYENEQWWGGRLPGKLSNHRRTENNRPVEIVTVDVAMAFCNWLSAQLNKDIRLPTE